MLYLSFQFNPVLVGGPGKKECFAPELKIISGLCYEHLNTDQSSCIRDKKQVLAVFYHNNASYICFTDVLEEWLALNSSMFILIRVMTSKTAQKCARLENLGQYKAVQTPRRVSSIFFIIIFSKVQPIFRWR